MPSMVWILVNITVWYFNITKAIASHKQIYKYVSFIPSTFTATKDYVHIKLDRSLITLLFIKHGDVKFKSGIGRLPT